MLSRNSGAAAVVALVCLTSLTAGGHALLPPARTPAVSELNKPLRLVASIFPLWDFARSVVGDRGEVRLLLPPGSDIHTWQPRPRDIVDISETDLFIANGCGLEPWLDELLQSRIKVNGRVLRAGAGLDVLEHQHRGEESIGPETKDPHVWLNFRSAEMMILRIRDELTVIDPRGGETYRRNAFRAREALRRLDGDFRTGLNRCPLKTIVLGGHAAFGYLAFRYGLKQVSLYGLSPDAEPTARHMARVVDLMRKEKLMTVFYEENTSRKLAEVLARETGANLVGLNPGSRPTRAELDTGITFVAIMRRNLANLRRGLGCD